MADIWICFYCKENMEEPEVLCHLSSAHNMTTKDRIDIEYTGSKRATLEHVFWCVPSNKGMRSAARIVRQVDK